MKGIRVALLMAVLVLVLGGGSIQAQDEDEVDLSQPGVVMITYTGGWQLLCFTEGLDAGWSGGMSLPPGGISVPMMWMSCEFACDYDTNVARVVFGPVSGGVVDLTLEDFESFCRPSKH